MEIADFYEKDLDKWIEEIRAFNSEEDIWKTKEGINNSAGNLTLHIAGNLNHFIGTIMANSGYVRKRDEEFSVKNIPREKLINDLTALKEMTGNTIRNLSADHLEKEFPQKINEYTFTYSSMLTFLLKHLNYHLGQVNYLRRLM